MQNYLIEAREGGLLFFTIKRAEKRNAINYEVMEGLSEAIRLAKKPHIKGLIVTGEGEKAFCSGGDLAVFHDLRTEEQAYGMLSKMGDILYDLLMLPKPTVALMNGTALGGGCELATACDIRVAHKDIKAGFVQGTLAITTGWGGGTILLEKLPLASGMKMLLEAKRYTASEMLELGFVHYIYEGEAAEGFEKAVGSIFDLDEGVLQAYKEVMIRKWSETNIKERIDMEIRKCSVLWEGEAHHNQVDKFINKSSK